MRLSLVIAFREISWRRPLRDPTVLEVWDDDARECLARLPVGVLEALIRMHLEMAYTQRELGRCLPSDRGMPPPPPVEPPPPLPVPMTRTGPRLRALKGRQLRGLGGGRAL